MDRSSLTSTKRGFLNKNKGEVIFFWCEFAKIQFFKNIETWKLLIDCFCLTIFPFDK